MYNAHESKKCKNSAVREDFCNFYRVLLSNGNLDYFATSDLCVVSRLAVAEFVKMNSIDGCMIASDEIVSSIYTLDDCR